MATPFASSTAYIIGIGNYQHTPWQLKTPLSDAQKLASILEREHQFTTQLLPDLTAGQLRDWIDSLPARHSREDERLLIYYAGHGLQRDSAYGLQGLLAPVDARPDDDSSMVPMETLARALQEVRSRHLLLILDCCFAGMFRMPTLRSMGRRRQEEPIYAQHYEIFTRFPSRLLLTSTSHRQKAYDRIGDDDPHSPFNLALCQALTATTAADFNRDRLLLASELQLSLTDSISALTQAGGNLQSIGLDALNGDAEGEFLFFLDGFDAARLPLQAYVNPYKGLNSYEANDASLFFGRQKATQKLLNKYLESPFVMVVGASGSGKSSLVKAGLLPILRRQHRIVPERITTIRPGQYPLQVLPPGNQWDVLVVDQWEEVITQVVDPEEVMRFYEQIHYYLERGKHIVGIIRSDFEAQARFAPLDSYWIVGRFTVPPFTAEELRDIIVQPARRVACRFEDEELVNRIVEEVEQQPGAMPLLSFMLIELFEQATSTTSLYRQINHHHYEAVGGVSGALSRRADTVLAELPDDDHRETMRRILLRMVALTGCEMAGRRVLLADLRHTDPAENDRIRQVIDRLEAANLINRDADHQQQTYIEPAHDALVRVWKQLWQWVNKLGKENLLLLQKLALAAADYQAQQQLSALLWAGDPRLLEVRSLLMTNPLMANAAEQTFISRSYQLRQRRRLSKYASLLLVMATLALTSLWAMDERRAAQHNELITLTHLSNFLRADSMRLSEEAAREQRYFEQYVEEGDRFMAAGDYDLALTRYSLANTIFQCYLYAPDRQPVGGQLYSKMQEASRLLNQGALPAAPSVGGGH